MLTHIIFALALGIIADDYIIILILSFVYGAVNCISTWRYYRINLEPFIKPLMTGQPPISIHIRFYAKIFFTTSFTAMAMSLVVFGAKNTNIRLEPAMPPAVILLIILIIASLATSYYGIRYLRSKTIPKGIRRLSIVATPVAHVFLAFVLAAAFSFGEYGDDREALASLYILQAILFVPSLTLLPLARRLYLWVRQGFEEDSKEEPANPQKEQSEQ